MATPAGSVVGCSRLIIVFSDVPASAALEKLGAISAIVCTSSPKSTPAVLAEPPTFERPRASSPTSTVEALAALASASATCVAVTPVSPHTPSCLLTIPAALARSSPDAAARASVASVASPIMSTTGTPPLASSVMAAMLSPAL